MVIYLDSKMNLVLKKGENLLKSLFFEPKSSDSKLSWTAVVPTDIKIDIQSLLN